MRILVIGDDSPSHDRTGCLGARARCRSGSRSPCWSRWGSGRPRAGGCSVGQHRRREPTMPSPNRSRVRRPRSPSPRWPPQRRSGAPPRRRNSIATAVFSSTTTTATRSATQPRPPPPRRGTERCCSTAGGPGAASAHASTVAAHATRSTCSDLRPSPSSSARIPSPSSGAALVEDRSLQRRTSRRCGRDFVANISHELKTPIGALGLLAETIRDEDDSPTASTSRRRCAASERMITEADRARTHRRRPAGAEPHRVRRASRCRRRAAADVVGRGGRPHLPPRPSRPASPSR